MATHHGKEGTIYVEGSAVAEVTSWEYNESANVVDDSQLIDTGKTFKATQKDGSGTIECHWDPADAEQLSLRSGAEVEVSLYPTGIEVADTRLYGDIIVDTIKVTGGRDGLSEATFTYKGVLTEEVIPQP